MAQTKNELRTARARKHHAKAKVGGKTRLIIYRSNKAIYAQIFDDASGKVLASASNLKGKSGIEGAKEVGTAIAAAAKKAKVTEVAFDRNGFKYQGQVQVLADSAREAGLKF